LRGGLVFTLMDVWVLNPDACRELNMVCWTPVDHEPISPKVHRFFQASGAIPLAMTEQGRRQLLEFDPLYCPHAIDTNELQPLGKDLVRDKLGIPRDAFLIGMVAANKGSPSRKSFVEVIEAFAQVRARHDNAMLYLHTDITGDFAHGVALVSLMDALNLPEESVKFADQYRLCHDPIPTSYMTLLYSAMDVLANPSTGEGFGIPMLEAQACGVPVVATDFTAMREIARVGWKVGGQRTWTYQESFNVIPSVAELVDVFEDCYGLSDDERAELSAKAREFALGYDIERVMGDFMLPALAAEDRLTRRRPVLVPARGMAA